MAVLVHVLGAVKRPGLVSLSTGARVVDAVAAAGGLTDDAEVSGINLARVVADGEQLVVPRVGEVVAPPTGGAGGGSPGASGASGAVVNLNTATQAELETLPRIGPALAGRILDYRTANGRFAAVTDLMKVTGIGQKVFDGLKDRIAV
jgi:competence protein ComEA